VTTLTAPARGTHTHATDPQLRALRIAAAGGYIGRGQPALRRAPITVLNALARRGYLLLDVQRHGNRMATVGAHITSAGRKRLEQLEA
jgi:hypothetical protein